MSRKYVQYSITISISAEEPLEDVVYDADSEEWTEENIRAYIMQDRWEFLAESVNYNDWDIYVKVVEKDD